MNITEPVTLLTDYLLGAWTLLLAVRLRSAPALSARLWAVAFAATAAAAIVGGSYHGFAPYGWVWKVTVYSLGLASLFMLAGALVASLSGSLRTWLLGATAAKFVVYALWMTTHDEFRYVIYDYAPSMIAVLLLQTWRWRTPSARWIMAGVLVSFGGAGIQQSGFALHRHFNHNDVYHVVQMAAMYLLYRGTIESRDAH